MEADRFTRTWSRAQIVLAVAVAVLTIIVMIVVPAVSASISARLSFQQLAYADEQQIARISAQEKLNEKQSGDIQALMLSVNTLTVKMDSLIDALREQKMKGK